MIFFNLDWSENYRCNTNGSASVEFSKKTHVLSYMPSHVQHHCTLYCSQHINMHYSWETQNYLSHDARKSVGGGGFDEVRHKPGCATREGVLRLEILDLVSRGIVKSM